MSRIGNKPLHLPKGVTVSVEENLLKVKGAKGELVQDFRPEVSFEIGEQEIVVKRKNDSIVAKSMHGLYRKLLENMITGVSTGFNKSLVINGVGYRAEMKGKNIVFSLGYSTLIEYQGPEDITLSCEGNNKVVVSGIGKSAVGQVAAEIRNLRPPEPYKGKGIRYENETVKRKVGKSGAK
ncbi:MAG: 50S ribosomal protein L6 [Spirochaetaceae bacterium]|jgi:large subunit ribosomal protein L6|nr:50S ribosomal protein L6 [Spirochaetaceae bacterium]